MPIECGFYSFFPLPYELHLDLLRKMTSGELFPLAPTNKRFYIDIINIIFERSDSESLYYQNCLLQVWLITPNLLINYNAQKDEINFKKTLKKNVTLNYSISYQLPRRVLLQQLDGNGFQMNDSDLNILLNNIHFSKDELAALEHLIFFLTPDQSQYMYNAYTDNISSINELQLPSIGMVQLSVVLAKTREPDERQTFLQLAHDILAFDIKDKDFLYKIVTQLKTEAINLIATLACDFDDPSKKLWIDTLIYGQSWIQWLSGVTMGIGGSVSSVLSNRRQIAPPMVKPPLLKRVTYSQKLYLISLFTENMTITHINSFFDSFIKNFALEIPQWDDLKSLAPIIALFNPKQVQSLIDIIEENLFVMDANGMQRAFHLFILLASTIELEDFDSIIDRLLSELTREVDNTLVNVRHLKEYSSIAFTHLAVYLNEKQILSCYNWMEKCNDYNLVTLIPYMNKEMRDEVFNFINREAGKPIANWCYAALIKKDSTYVTPELTKLTYKFLTTYIDYGNIYIGLAPHLSIPEREEIMEFQQNRNMGSFTDLWKRLSLTNEIEELTEENSDSQTNLYHAVF